MNSTFGSSWGGWCSSEPIGGYGVGLWKNIRRCLRMFWSHTRFKVGDGSERCVPLLLIGVICVKGMGCL